MSQSSVSPNVNPKRNRPPPPSPNASLQSDIHFNSGLANNTAVASSTASMAGTLKRPREYDYGEAAEARTSTDVPEPKRRVKATHDVIYRIVVPSRQIGKVIGRAGHRIQKIREDTHATIKIADAISFFLDRYRN